MYKKIILAGLFLALFSIIISTPLTAQAALIEPTYVSPDTGNKPYEEGNYTLNDIMGVVIGASNWILGIVGSLALLMFIYGGFMFLISAGSSDKIGQAQKILVAAVVGLIIVFASYMIIRFVSQAMGVDWQGGKIITASPAAETTTSGSGATTIPTDCVEKYGNEFSCRSESGAGYCIANHCGSGANVCCHESCSEELGSQSYSCIDYNINKNVKDCKINYCPSETGKNMKCCIPK